MKTTAFFTLASMVQLATAHWKRLPQMLSNTTSAATNLTSIPTGFNTSTQKTGEYTRCASSPTDAQRRLLDDFSTPQYEETGRTDRVVEVYVHVVSTAAKRSRYNNDMIQNQMVVMNDAFAGTGFSFELVGFDITVQETWAKAAAGSFAETAMKKSLKRGNYRDLNLYFLSDLGDGLLGFCYFPTTNPSSQMQILDGCINLADSMPGGAANNYNLGLTAVHEVGHWFGLYHVFEGANCNDAKGDRVGDTPRQSTPTTGCPASKDSCPGIKGLDSINNYMDYSYDSCLFDFTAGQSRRMRALFDSTRASS
ncbi:Putative peptidase M43, pregnancy-associated plasma-A [Septoria linicola]|uniref:Peptidase M43, pregnancy-associated plasma-A n=1 Tax=Septoria linicola TaxID=215465 RepID=A0A9Q9ELU9_9PEZI|nr:Putative peptidase M43, pregnancy-associated plasma-A [Septoria linicola]